jgi:hypothetical protein
MCAWVGNQRSHGVVTTRVQTDAVRSLRHQRQDLHQSTYPVPLGRSELMLLSEVVATHGAPPHVMSSHPTGTFVCCSSHSRVSGLEVGNTPSLKQSLP